MGPYCDVCSNYHDQCVCKLIDLVQVTSCPPYPDCRLCLGSGFEVFGDHDRCDCTKVCDCGEHSPNNLESCSHPGCTVKGCDACDEIKWCCDPDDVDCGDGFCSDHRGRIEDVVADTECQTCGIGFRLPSGRCDHCNTLFE